MSTPTQTGAQAPSTPAPSFVKKNRAMIALSAIVVLAFGVIAGLLIGRSGSTTPAAAAAASTEAPAAIATTVAPAVTTSAPAPVVVAPVTTVPATTNNTQPVGILAKPSAQDDYPGWVKYLQSVYSTALQTSDSSLLVTYYSQHGAAYQHNVGSTTGHYLEAMSSAQKEFRTQIGTVQAGSIHITYINAGSGFSASFLQGSSTFNNEYLWVPSESVWKVSTQSQND